MSVQDLFAQRDGLVDPNHWSRAVQDNNEIWFLNVPLHKFFLAVSLWEFLDFCKDMGEFRNDKEVYLSQTVFLKLGSSTTTPVMFVYEEDKA